MALRSSEDIFLIFGFDEKVVFRKLIGLPSYRMGFPVAYPDFVNVILPSEVAEAANTLKKNPDDNRINLVLDPEARIHNIFRG